MHYVRINPQEVWYDSSTICFIPPIPQRFAIDNIFYLLINKMLCFLTLFSVTFYVMEFLQGRLLPYVLAAINNRSLNSRSYFLSLKVDKTKSTVCQETTKQTILYHEAFAVMEPLLSFTKPWNWRLPPEMLNKHLLTGSFTISMMILFLFFLSNECPPYKSL